MSCILSKGIKLDCSNNTGGIESVWLAPTSVITSVITDEVNGSPQTNDGTITSIGSTPTGYNAYININFPANTFKNLTLTGDYTNIFKVGTQVNFTATIPPGGGSAGYTANITSVSYDSALNTTTILVSSLNSTVMNAGSTTAYTFNPIFMKFETLRNSISFEQPSSINLDNGSTFYTHTIQFQIPKQDTAKRNKLYQLAAGNGKFLAIVKDMNGQYWISGLQSDGSMNVALQISTSNAMSGKSKGDMNGYDVTLTAELNTLAFKINPNLVALVDGTTTW